MACKELKVDETMSIDELLTLIEELLKQVKIRLIKKQLIQHNSR